jgi:integrase
LVNDTRSARTVSDIWVVAARTVLGWAFKEPVIRSNSFDGVSIRVPRAVLSRDGKEFHQSEISTILNAALAVTDTKRASKAACRWVPWLCAYSGARSGEITQLRGQDIEHRQGFVAMKLTPDTGTTKNAKTRTVPLHEHLIAQGFMDCVRVKGRGLLLYNPAMKTVAVDVTNPRAPCSMGS